MKTPKCVLVKGIYRNMTNIYPGKLNTWTYALENKTCYIEIWWYTKLS